jgi:flagellar hook-length control protein FliK
MKLSLPAMPPGPASGPAIGGDEAATGLGAMLAGGEDGMVRPMEEALAFASLLLQAGPQPTGNGLPIAGEAAGKVLPPMDGAPDGAASADSGAIAAVTVQPGGTALIEGAAPPGGGLADAAGGSAQPGTPADGDALAALVSLLQAGSQSRGAESAAPVAASPGQRADGGAPIRRPIGAAVTGPEAAHGGARNAIADGQQAQAADLALPGAGEAKPPQRPTADAMALLRSTVIEPGAAGATDAARPTGDVRGLSAALLGAQPAAVEPASVTADRALVTVRAPLGGEQWADSFAERVGWVVHKRLGSAEVRLNPAHLGPVEVSIKVDEEQARVVFSASHAATREAIEQAVPRLREMLAQQGLDLRQTDVGDFASGNHGDPRPGDTAAGGDRDAGAGSGRGDESAAAESAAGDPGPGERRAVKGLIDTFV